MVEAARPAGGDEGRVEGVSRLSQAVSSMHGCAHRCTRSLAMLAELLDFILAPACLACDRWIDAADQARLICRRCRALIRTPPAPICERCGAPLLKTGRTREHTC